MTNSSISVASVMASRTSWTRLPPAPLSRRRLGNEQHSPSPFATKTHSLQQAQQDEKDGSQDANLLIRWQQANQESAEAHQHHGQHEHRLAAHPVAEVAEDDAAQRSSGIPNRIDAEGRECADRRIRRWKKEPPKNERCRSAVDEEIVPLDDGPEGTCRHDLARRGRPAWLGVILPGVADECREW